MNACIEIIIKNCPTCLEFQATQPKDKIMPHEIPVGLWESVGPDIFTINNYHLSLCCRIPQVVKQVEGFVEDNLIKHARLYFQSMDYSVRYFQKQARTSHQGCLKASVEGLTFNMQYHHHQSNGQAEACIKFLENHEKML